MNPLRKYQKKNNITVPIFDNLDQKFRNEIFTVFRTIQDLMILNSNDHRIQKHFLLPGINNKP